VIRFLRWFITGDRPAWLPSSTCIEQAKKDGSYCLFEGFVLPRGNRWWIFVTTDRSGTKGAIEARCGPATNSSKEEPAIRMAELPSDEVRRICGLLEMAAKAHGRVRQEFIKDGFPANLRLSLLGRFVKFRCNLAVRSEHPDPRVELASAVFAIGRTLIDKPSLYGFCTMDGQLKLGRL
jgi:hypothetical protein